MTLQNSVGSPLSPSPPGNSEDTPWKTQGAEIAQNRSGSSARAAGEGETKT